MMRKSKSNKLRGHAEDWATDLADKVGPRVDSARDAARVKAAPYLAEARAKAAPVIADARHKAGPVISDARDKAGPMIADAREKAGPMLDDAKQRWTTEVLPVLAAAVAAADEATEEARVEGKKRGKAAVAALRGDVEAPAKKRHRVRKALLILGLGGVIAAVAKKLSDRPATTTWQSSYSPEPTPAGSSGGAHRAEDESDDQGGSSPDVVAADEAAEPHAATTPDNPAETVDVSKK